MDINKAISKEALKWRCRQHPKFPSDLICLDGDVKDRIMCLNCAQKQSIPLSNLLTMSLVLNANEHDILEAYPPLKDYELSEKLIKISLQQQLEEIEVFFKKLRENIEKEIQVAEQKAKEALIKQGKDNQEILERYRNIAEIEKLKKLIVSEKQSAEKDLDSFIKEKWNKADENRKVMKELMDRYETKYNFSSDEPNRIAQETIERLKGINFFSGSITQKINLIKSSIGSPQSMEITKVNDQTYQIKQVDSNDWGQVYIDPCLNPQLKYIVNIELEVAPENEGDLNFGLMAEENKDNDYGFNYYMCYQDNFNGQGIHKQIKGNVMQYENQTGKRNFEVRICLNEKFLRVASLPDYSSIVELDDPNKINPKVGYRFFLSMLQQGDVMRITNFRTVSKYDEKM